MSDSDKPVVAWDSSWPTETTTIAYEEARQAAVEADKWADAIDNKVVAVFSVGAVIVSLIPSLQEGVRSGAAALLWLGSLAAFLVAAYHSYRAYEPRGFRFGPDPDLLRCKEWLSLPPAKYRFKMLRYLGKNFAHNRAVLDSKAEALGRAIGWIAVEVAALAIALLLAGLN